MTRPGSGGGRRRREGQAIERTLDGIERLACDVEIAARGGQRRVAQQYLDGPEVDAGFKKVRGEGVAPMSMET
jgi:hypothetical protein